MAALITGYFVSERQAKESALLQRDVADARRRQADAERTLLEQHRAYWSREYLRTLRSGCIYGNLDRKPTATIKVLYQGDNSEAFGLAHRIWSGAKRAHWDVEESPQPLPPQNFQFDEPPSLSNIRDFGLTGILLSPRSTEIAEGTPEQTLVQALTWCGAPPKVIVPFSSEAITVIVGPIPGPR